MKEDFSLRGDASKETEKAITVSLKSLIQNIVRLKIVSY